MTALASKELCDLHGWYLDCPECDTPAIPASRHTISLEPLWSEDDEPACPGCGTRLRANITGPDDDEGCMEAIVISARCDTCNAPLAHFGADRLCPECDRDAYDRRMERVEGGDG